MYKTFHKQSSLNIITTSKDRSLVTTQNVRQIENEALGDLWSYKPVLPSPEYWTAILSLPVSLLAVGVKATQTLDDNNYFTDINNLFILVWCCTYYPIY